MVSTVSRRSLRRSCGFAVWNLIRGLCLVRFPASLRDSSGLWGTHTPR